MKYVDRDFVDAYLQNDWVAEILTGEDANNVVCDKWLIQSEAKRAIFDNLYSDLVKGQTNLTVLDVGGGVSSFSRRLIDSHNYVLADLLAHGGWDYLAQYYSETQMSARLHQTDWYALSDERKYDIVIANDIFPNVDQRLKLFLNKFLPISSEIRLSLTYYNNGRFYITKRTEADEVMCMSAWDGEILKNVLRGYCDRIRFADFSVFDRVDTVYPNGRLVCLITLNGDLETGRQRMSDG